MPGGIGLSVLSLKQKSTYAGNILPAKQSLGSKKRLAKRPGYDTGVLDELLAADDERRRLQADLDQVLGEQNRLAKEIGHFWPGKREEAERLKEQVSGLKEQSGDLRNNMMIQPMPYALCC